MAGKGLSTCKARGEGFVKFRTNSTTCPKALAILVQVRKGRFSGSPGPRLSKAPLWRPSMVSSLRNTENE